MPGRQVNTGERKPRAFIDFPGRRPLYSGKRRQHTIESPEEQPATSLQDRFEDLRRRNEAAELAGGPERIARQHKAGKRTARERLEVLLDKGSFAEVDRFVVHQGRDFGVEEQ